MDSRHKNREVLRRVILVIENVSEKQVGCMAEAVGEWDRKAVDLDKMIVSCVKKCR